MKIALCLYGKIGNKNSKGYKSTTCSTEVLKIGHDFYAKNLFPNNNVDVFIHSWSLPLKNNILDLYKPTDFIIEKQETFNIPPYVRGGEDRKQAHYSRWKSTKMVTNLLSSSTSDYDLVIISRFDLAWKIIPETLDINNFYIQQWCCFGYNGVDEYNIGQFNKRAAIDISKLPHFHKGLEYGMRDWWFMSSKENIIKFGTLFDHMDEYSKSCNDSAGIISSHVLAEHHLKQLGMYEKIILKYHIIDTPLIRREIFKSYA